MRETNIVYLKKVIKEHPQNFLEPIVEIGSFRVPKQEKLANLRPLFPNKKYIGCDMRDGLGVDKIEDAHQLTFKDNSIGSIICIDTLEHIENPHKAMEEAYRVLKPNGICVIVSVMNFPIHDHPSDYWRFTPSAFELLLKPFAHKKVESNGGKKMFPRGIYGFGIK